MANPTTRQQFIDNCLRRLGAPVLEINVSEEQIDDRVDEALSYYWDYHFDGTEKIYYKHQVTEQDKQNGYIILPENIIGAVNLFTVGDALNTNNMFNIRYQIALNDLYTLTNVSMVPYYMALQHIRVLEELLVGKQMIRYTRHRNRLHIDMDWNRLADDKYLIVEAYEVLDPATYPDVWKDRWLLQYATALIKRQWGTNLKKFEGMKLPGGLTFNGQQIYDEAIQEITKMEDEMILNYSAPLHDLVGAFLILLNTPLIFKLMEYVNATGSNLPLVG